MWWKKIKSILYDSFLFILIYELIEEAIEEAIAYFITDALSYVLSKFLCISLTQTIKIGLKKFIKLFVYKEGNDKMKIIKDFLYNIYHNKFTIGLILLSSFSGYCAYVIVPLKLWAKISIAIAILVFGILCSVNIGWESNKQIKERLKDKIEAKEIKKQNKLKLKEEKIKKQEIEKIAKEMQLEKIKEIEKNKEEEIKILKENVLKEAEKKYNESVIEQQNDLTKPL